uniref:Thioredoxin domain-containing protein n=1 Tax=Nelumbo nucifera TaxID=4432 RepID=A0A822XT92_NELNU|nr:TPA_asm: hypothetical protein HUJ06_023772 [Nelumbo nucifera]
MPTADATCSAYLACAAKNQVVSTEQQRLTSRLRPHASLTTGSPASSLSGSPPYASLPSVGSPPPSLSLPCYTQCWLGIGSSALLSYLRPRSASLGMAQSFLWICGVFDGHGKNGHIISKLVRNRLPLLVLDRKNALSVLKMPGLTIGDTVPNLEAETTKGKFKLHDYIGDSWAIILSRLEDFTPVCMTELGKMAAYEEEFSKRRVKLLGLSCDDIQFHNDRIKDIEAYTWSFLLHWPWLHCRGSGVGILLLRHRLLKMVMMLEHLWVRRWRPVAPVAVSSSLFWVLVVVGQRFSKV